MKKQILILLMFLVTVGMVAQKNELKAADKALKKNDLALAKSSLAKCDNLIAGADNKLKAKYYFLKGKTYAKIGKEQPALDANAYDVAADALNNLIDFEKKIGKKTYSNDAAPIFNTLIADIRAAAVKQYQAKEYLKSAQNFAKVYKLSPKDTFMLDNAANAAHLGKLYKEALGYYIQLNELGYKGVSTVYKAKNTETGKFETFSSKSQRDIMMKTGKYSESKDDVSKSRAISIIKNIAFMYGKLGENKKGLDALTKARAAYPNDYNLLLAEADLQIKLGNREKFGQLMKEAVDKNPNEPMLYFNLGVISNEQNKDADAIKYYKKAIELDPNYFDAYVNMANVYRKAENRIIDDMNKNLSDFDKYDVLKAKLSDLYKKVLPFYEKAYYIKKDDISVVQTLMGIYENLDMETKYKALKAEYDILKSK
ncbi:MAG: tetratricopeptide repeat protein [Flavobacteriaceae bacterium]